MDTTYCLWEAICIHTCPQHRFLHCGIPNGYNTQHEQQTLAAQTILRSIILSFILLCTSEPMLHVAHVPMENLHVILLIVYSLDNCTTTDYFNL